MMSRDMRHLSCMIGSIKHKGLKRLHDSGERKLIRPDLVERCEMILAALEAATTINELDQQTFKLHPMKGDRLGFWSIKVRANWRMLFRFDGDTANDVDLDDPHTGHH